MPIQEPSEEPFDISDVPREVKSQPFAEKKAAAKKPAGLGAPPAGPTSTVDTYEKLLLSIPEFSTFGQLFKVLHWHDTLTYKLTSYIRVGKFVQFTYDRVNSG